MAKKVTKVALVGFLKDKLTHNKEWAIRALVRIYDNQTLSEQRCETTTNDNGVGFTVQDARFLTRLAEFYKNRGFLTDKQMVHVYAAMGKYAGQLVKMEYFSWEKLEKCYLKANTVA